MILINNNNPIISSGIDTLTILMGFSDGRIRVTNVRVDDMINLSDYIEYSVHDNRSGRVKTLCFSQDCCMLFTYGDDGNIFSFMFQLDGNATEISISNLPESPNFVVSLKKIRSTLFGLFCIESNFTNNKN